jgi:hypothetical protein
LEDVERHPGKAFFPDEVIAHRLAEKGVGLLGPEDIGIVLEFVEGNAVDDPEVVIERVDPDGLDVKDLVDPRVGLGVLAHGHDLDVPLGRR